MRLFASSCLALAAMAAPASAGFVTSAVIDDFSGSPGLGYSLGSDSTGVISGGVGSLQGSQYFSYLSDTPGFNASAFTGVSLKVDGSLGSGGLFIGIIGADFGFVALDVNYGSTISNGYAWITFDQLDAAVGNDPGTIQAALSSGVGVWGIAVYTTGNASISVDDFEFRTSAVPAPGALALAAAAGLAATRRRR